MKIKAIQVAPDSHITEGNVYEVLKEWNDDYDTYYQLINDRNDVQDYYKYRFEIVSDDVVVVQPTEVPVSIDSHYNFNYSLSPEDIDNGYIKLDPYFVAKQWNLGAKDPSGVIWHIFKTCARFGEKNEKSREIEAIYKSIKRLAELEGTNLA